VRLDHLLSKEQLGWETSPVARDLRMSGWGAHRRRHWPVRLPATAGTPSTAILLGVVGTEGAGAAGRRRLAPCWVLKEQPLRCEPRMGVLLVPGMTCLSYRVGEPAPVGVVFLMVWWESWGCGLVVG
jgi:hypothetical protein